MITLDDIAERMERLEEAIDVLCDDIRDLRVARDKPPLRPFLNKPPAPECVEVAHALPSSPGATE